MLTVIIPCYRAKATVIRTVDSVLQAKETQILVVDDACPDGTGAHVSKTYNHESRVKVITHDKNLGLGAARNSGLDQSVTEFVAFLDADDYWTQGPMIGTACQEMSKLNAEAGFMPAVIHTGNDKQPHTYPDYELIAPLTGKLLNIESTSLLSVVQPCWSIIYRRQFLMDNHIRFHRRKFEDHDFGLEIVLTTSALLVLTTSPTVHYDKTREGTLSSSELTKADHQLFLAHVTRVIELLNKRSDLPEQSRAERVQHYTLRLVHQLFAIEHLTDGMILDSLNLIHLLRLESQVIDFTKNPENQSEQTVRLLSRHPNLMNALDRTLVNERRFIHSIRLLRFARKGPLGKGRTLARLGLKAVSMLWK